MDYEELIERSDDAVASGKMDEARGIINEGLEYAREHGDEAYVQLLLGELEYLDDDYEAASGHVQRAYELDGDNPLMLRQKAVSMGYLGKEEEAIEFLDRALAIKPDDYNALREKGVSLSRLGKDKEAIGFYGRALDINPDDHYALRQKGVSLANCGKKQEAIEFFDRALAIKLDDYHALRDKGATLLKLGKEDAAAPLFEAAHRIRPDDPRSIFWLAGSKKHFGDTAEALRLYHRFIALARPTDVSLISYAKLKIAELERSSSAGEKGKLQEKSRQTRTQGQHVQVLAKVIDALQTATNNAFLDTVKREERRFEEFVTPAPPIPADFPSFLSVLRKWNSYTPLLPSKEGENLGGGYFLYHKGKGIVIDPGFKFIENFCAEGFSASHIDAVLITHDHNDHTVDFEAILSLLRKLREKDEKKAIDVFINVGALSKFSGWLPLNPPKDGYIRRVEVLHPGMSYPLGEDYGGLTIHAMRAKHEEMMSDRYCIGLVLEAADFKIGLSGDTGWAHDGSIGKQFARRKPDLMVLHIGSVKEKEIGYASAETEEERQKCFYENHLGLLGITRMADTIRPKLIVLSEFGEELKDVRMDIADALQEATGVSCIPGDIGLHIRLDDLGVLCFVEEDFVPYGEAIVVSEGHDLWYHKDCRGDQRYKNAESRRKTTWQLKPVWERVRNK